MKKIVQLLLVVAMLFSVSTVAYSAPGLYIGANLGLAFFDDSDIDIDRPDIPRDADVSLSADNGLSFGGFLGYAFENGYRIEGELVYQRNNYDELKVSYLDMSKKVSLDGNISSAAVLANGYYDFKNESRVTPFIGGGFGFAVVKDSESDDNDTVFVYQLSAGVGFEITEKITLDLKYRYVVTEDLDSDYISVEYSSDILYTGLRFSF